MAREEYLFKFSMLEQEANKINENLQIINQQIAEFEVLKLSLRNIIKDKEMLAGLGKGIFVKSEIKDKELFVNIGSGIVVKKSPEEACKIIDRQILQIAELKQNLLNEIEKINFKMQALVEEARKESS